MYAYEWDSSTGGYILTPMPLAFSKEPRPVYYKELDILGFDKYWDYDKNDSFPYMWAEANNYYYRGRLVAKTKGGSLYIPPELVLIEDPEPEGYPLRFVDIPAMVDKNRQLMEQLVQETIKKIYNTFIEYQDKVDVFYVAFSGGKDSVVALDLVQRALPHNCFKVLFGDTGMEFPDTYETVEKIKQICAEEKIEFLQAKSKLKPENTWQIFGPPAVTIRWCCSVHKTTPQIMQLREVLQKPDFTGMAFTGVRGDESLSRSEYDAISYGGKHSGQYSCHPILEWNTAELFLYIYENGLTFNNAYKKGNTRAGCLVCPMSQGKHDYIPKKEDWMSIKNKIIYENESVQILTKISVDINIKTGEISFAIPDFGVTEKETLIEPAIWDVYKEDLINTGETWGIIKLGYRPPDDTVKPKIPGKIKLTGFKNFRPYTVDIEYFKEMRSNFETDEWIDILLGAIDYNADGYETKLQKLTMLTRLLPFVEKRINLIELAPKGTGKSYVFGHISKNGLLTDGGKVTRSKMFYDANRRKPGYICGPDYVAIDEVKLVNFGDENEMRSILQGYLEYGTFNSNGYNGESDAGVVFLGNIKEENMDEYGYMLGELPTLFQETALLDRIHGFVKGWDIPRMNDGLKLTGWALNSEYFCSILHELRNDMSYRAIVEKIVEVPKHADTRDTEAIKRLATAYLKLLFPNVRNEFDVDKMEFRDYCLTPAMKMRRIIKLQQGMIDSEYKNKDVPCLMVRE